MKVRTKDKQPCLYTAYEATDSVLDKVYRQLLILTVELPRYQAALNKENKAWEDLLGQAVSTAREDPEGQQTTTMELDMVRNRTALMLRLYAEMLAAK